MKLYDLVNRYIAHKQSLGAKFEGDGAVLSAFCRWIGDVSIDNVRSEDVLRYLNETGKSSKYWMQRHGTIRRLFEFAIVRGHVFISPMPKSIRKTQSTFSAYIYTNEEVKRMLNNVAQACNNNLCKLHPYTLKTLLLLLWGTGLRISEALTLTLADVDTTENILTIRDTKFFKSRLVPLHIVLATPLYIYLKKRRRLPLPEGENSVVFCTKAGEPISRNRVGIYFRKLREITDIRREQESSFQPRIHDFRHTFAVNRLINWYRNGDDVQQLLPHLSTYLGHASIRSTQQYLDATPELLQEANLRFERYAMGGLNDE